MDIARLLFKNARIHQAVIESLPKDNGSVWKIIPFKNYYMPGKLKILQTADLSAVTLRERVLELNKNHSVENNYWILNTMENYCKKAMLVPTYDDVVGVISKETGRTQEGERRKLQAAFAAMKHMTSGPAKQKKKAELEELSLKVGFFFTV